MESLQAAADQLIEATDSNAVPDLCATPPRRIALMIEPTPFTHISGYSNRFKEMLKYIHKAGDSAAIVTTDDSPDAPSSFLGYPIANTKGFRCPVYKHIVLTFDTELVGWSVIEKLKPDVLHVTSPGFINFAALLYARIFRVPLVFSYHTHLPVYAKTYWEWFPRIEELAYFLLRFVHNRADLTLVTSPQMKDVLESQGVERVDVWRKGIDTERFNPSFKSPEMRARLAGGRPEAPLLIYVGRLGSEKRLREIATVMDRLPDTRMAFVGAGPDANGLKEHFARFGERVTFTGAMTGTALSQAFASADVFLMPSDTETLGFVVLEAMASGVPVVAARAGGIPDLIEDGRTGFLCTPGDAAAWAERTRALLEDAALRQRVAAAGRAETEQHSWEAATSYLRNVQYKRAIMNFKTRAFAGLGLPRTRTKWRFVLMQCRRVVLAVQRAVAAVWPKIKAELMDMPPPPPAATN
ncbi:glycosyl transferase, group 1 [Tribonema minus]|uniref:Glycosyl transferase, group 1 n=1 Tax=Tribonema minus TaxID=303371 RepID=A0A835ZJ95_9STRA|nr:glycosyl transferase, group 1 [Tribonema minus]